MRRKTMLLVSVMAGAVLVATVAGVAWAVTIITCDGAGDRDPDTLECAGTRQVDILNGTTGHDLILAKRGNDNPRDGDGNDEVHGGRGDDNFNGGAGNDTLYGELGHDDAIDGGPGDDALYGGDSNDVLLDQSAGGDFDIASGGPGNDSFILNDGDGLDWICTGRGTDTDIRTDPGDHVDDADFCNAL